MSITKLGASHLASDGYEVQRTNNFEVILSGIGEITGNVNDTRTITLSVNSFFLPSEESSSQELHYGNTLVKVAGTVNYSGGSLVVKDVISENEDVENIIIAWRKSVYDPSSDKVGLGYNYKKDARVIQYAPDGTIERTWKLLGVWPRAVNYGNLDYGSGGSIKQIEVQLEYDKAIRV
jgi:hypothetical protein